MRVNRLSDPNIQPWLSPGRNLLYMASGTMHLGPDNSPSFPGPALACSELI